MSDSVADYQFLITQGGRQDLLACRKEDPWAASRISVLLREIAQHKFYAEWLADPTYSDDTILDVGELASFRAIKINAYRVKFVEIGKWRLIVSIDHPTHRVALMAVMHRDDNYEEDEALWADIEREYDELGFTRV
ncbi:MAG: hypothetical protein EOP62_23265 [Sphingomonadales bacterium]|nr:MAG: hypothetical protein EOP62_23265 [Sphingomonadales bacterium]